MTRRRTVKWTDAAARDLERLALRLQEVAPLRADAIVDRILARGDALSTLSDRGRTLPELRPIADRIWLEVIESPWRIVYRVVGGVAGGAVEIHAVLDGRRDLRELLLDRLLD